MEAKNKQEKFDRLTNELHESAEQMRLLMKDRLSRDELQTF